MKKVLSILSLVTILSMFTPVFAAPGGGHGGHHGNHRIHVGTHHRPHITPRHHHGGIRIHLGSCPRHGHWRFYRSSYWDNTWCDYRLGFVDPYYCRSILPYMPVNSAAFSIRF